MPIVPVNDLHSVSCENYRKGERLLRCKLASLYRIVDIFGWNRGMNNRITVRMSKGVDEFLINPLGLLFHEITASSLVKIDSHGTVLNHDNLGMGIDKTGWLMHYAVHEARPDVRCIIHLGTASVIAVSSSKSGLLPVSQEAMILGGSVTYDPMSAVLASGGRLDALDASQQQALAELLTSSDAMLLFVKNSGCLVMGKSIEEAWYNAYLLTIACDSQLRLAGIDSQDVVLPSEQAQQAAFQHGASSTNVQMQHSEVGVNWRRGELEFEALMRRLDAAGYRTGHVYRVRQVKAKQAGAAYRQRQSRRDHPDGGEGIKSPPVRSGTKDVEIPPTASSFSASFYDDGQKRATLAAEAARSKSHTLNWVTSPNTYAREEIAETGTDNPALFSHWKASTIGGGTIHLANTDQFVPVGGNPHELKHQRMKVRDRYFKDVKSAGPKSRLLEGLDDADDESDGGPQPPPTSTLDGTKSPKSGTLLRLDPTNPPQLEPGHVVMVGAASRGIIDSKQRHNVASYQTVYSPNPFDRVTDADLDRYKENVDRKGKGLPSVEEEEQQQELEAARQAAETARQAMIESEKRHKPPKSPRKLFSHAPVIRSDTSGAEASHDDTDKETKKDDSTGRERRKKYRFKMPSFSRKPKSSK